MIHGLLFCGGSQGKSSLIIKLGAGAFQKNMMPEQKVFDSSLEFHRFLLGMEIFFFFTVFSWFVLVSVMRNSLDGFSFIGWMILGEAGVKGLQEIFKSSLVFLTKLLAVCCQDLFLSELVDRQGKQRQKFILSLAFQLCSAFQLCDISVV